jgi:LmbE family N-acetylglucosaminyl deacetylase
LKILAIHAHPDDLEFLAGGTLTLLKKDHEITLVTFTPGDCGTVELRASEIAAIRRGEARKAAAMLGAEYECLEQRDLNIEATKALTRKVTELLRRVRPELVFAASPQDYMADHENASALVRDACFNAPVPNYDTREKEPAPPLPRIPHLYYLDPIELVDAIGRPVHPQFVVDISDVIDQKVDLLACHDSQREWLKKHHGMDAYIEFMRRWSKERGQTLKLAFAEGFRQHLGHAYPRENILADFLPGRIYPWPVKGGSER